MLQYSVQQRHMFFMHRTFTLYLDTIIQKHYWLKIMVVHDAQIWEQNSIIIKKCKIYLFKINLLIFINMMSWVLLGQSIAFWLLEFVLKKKDNIKNHNKWRLFFVLLYRRNWFIKWTEDSENIIFNFWFSFEKEKVRLRRDLLK